VWERARRRKEPARRRRYEKQMGGYRKHSVAMLKIQKPSRDAGPAGRQVKAPPAARQAGATKIELGPERKGATKRAGGDARAKKNELR
jgi:hypothetical protein